MSTIKLTDDVVVSEDTIVELTFVVGPPGCLVHITDGELLGAPTWEQMDDVEALAKVFADVTVRYFEVIVCNLGKAYAMKDLV